jgi:hypothetical protein
MRALSTHRFFGQLAPHVVIEADERVIVAGLAAIPGGLLPHRVSVAGVVPPVIWRLTSGRNHPRHQNQHIGREPIGNQRCGERTERLTHHNQTGPVTHGRDHGVRLLGEAGRFVIGRKLGSDHVVSMRTQLGLDQVPVPPAVTRAVDQHKHAHHPQSLPGQLARSWSP